LLLQLLFFHSIDGYIDDLRLCKVQQSPDNGLVIQILDDTCSFLCLDVQLDPGFELKPVGRCQELVSMTTLRGIFDVFV
jgi:hypothetical protein